MKKLYLLILGIVIAANSFSQGQTAVKPDIITKINGEELQGKVIKITDNDVSFIFNGETTEYVIKKTDIKKITHSSGRVEIFSQTAPSDQAKKEDGVMTAASPADHHNKIAILPFTFLMDNQPGAKEIGLKAQGDTYAYLSQHSAGYTIVDPRTANAMLIKAGATRDKMAGFTMKELCDILGVEYIIDGTVTQNKESQISSSNGYGSATVKGNGDKNVSGYSSNSTYTDQHYVVSVSLLIYMDTNSNIFSQTRKNFWANTDGSYNSQLEYLLKKSPLYRN